MGKRVNKLIVFGSFFLFIFAIGISKSGLAYNYTFDTVFYYKTTHHLDSFTKCEVEYFSDNYKITLYKLKYYYLNGSFSSKYVQVLSKKLSRDSNISLTFSVEDGNFFGFSDGEEQVILHPDGEISFPLSSKINLVASGDPHPL